MSLTSILGEYERRGLDEEDIPDGNSFNSNSSSNSSSNGTDYQCSDTYLSELQVGAVIVPLTVLMFFLLHCAEPRRCCAKCCCGRCGVLLSVNFLENKTSRSMVVAGFTLTTYSIWDMIDQLQNISVLPQVAQVLFKVSLVGSLSLSYLPLFNCISVRSLFRQVVGLVYTAASMPLMVLFVTSSCPYHHITTDTFLAMVVEDLIIIFSGTYLIYKFCFRIAVLRNWSRRKSRTWEESYQVQYVKHLLSPKNKDVPDDEAGGKLTGRYVAVVIRWFHRNVYDPLPGFRYSTTILTSIVVGLLICLMLLSSTFGDVYNAYKTLKSLIEDNRDALNGTMPNMIVSIAKVFSNKKNVPTTGQQNEEEEDVDYFAPENSVISIAEFLMTQLYCVYGCFVAASLVPMFGLCVMVLHMLRSYRKNVLRLYRQQKTNQQLLDLSNTSNVDLVCYATQFAGYQVAHLVWGYGLQAIVLFIFLMFIGELLVLPCVFGYWGSLYTFFNWLLPIIVLIVLTRVIQSCLVKRYFLEDRGEVLALKNRKSFFNMMYFFFFYNIFAGLVSCLLRILKSLVFGVWFFPRLDRSIFPRSFERFDFGFHAYACLLRLEELQTNVILIVFKDILLRQVELRDEALATPVYDSELCLRPLSPPDFFCVESSTVEAALTTLNKKRVNKLARNRWHLAWTLLHNEGLREERQKRMKMMMMTTTMTEENGDLATTLQHQLATNKVTNKDGDGIT